MLQIMDTVRDRGSRYAASGGEVADAAAIKSFLTALKSQKKFAKATHNTWAALLPDGTALKDDDGESGASAVILKMLEREGRRGRIVVVTRWYGGVNLGGDRFAHVVTSVRLWLAEAAKQ
ncbi:YigZ family protein [Stagnihabitans tardus]|uniref:YigZ family protein n=1 Tax=Stagnihabitans tardus TaxID=2699202 RepID=A0AAE4YAK4_9RHOB|nr:YigZ family protein [Stagnihabitans tardus]NBZ88142.1 YigZ family protein [Stagnihabitans tardus]